MVIKPNFELTDGQRELVDMVTTWYKTSNSKDFIYSGPAGTGKTSVLPFIMDKLGLDDEEVIFATFTGKAASVLARKGFDARTIHSAFYDLKEVPKVRNNKVVMKNGRVCKDLKFVPKEIIDSHVKLIVIDEWSMVSDELADVIYKFHIPVLASGDGYQLPPIFGESPFKSRIKYNLTEITRQGKDSGIIQLATMIREGKDIPGFYSFRNDAHIYPKMYLQDRHLLDADIILTATNKTRNIFNDKVRDLHGSYGKLPAVGDKLICRKNKWNMTLNGIPLINGTLGRVINPIRRSDCDLNKGLYRIDFQPDYAYGTDEYYESLPCDYGFLNQPCGNKEIDEFNFNAKLEYGEASTVHLSQGSQYDYVVYWDEITGEPSYMRRLRYTAVTRAVKKVYMFV